MNNNFPFYKEILYQQPFLLFSIFEDQPWSAFLDSSQTNVFGRYSFIGIDPFQKMTSKNNQTCLNNKTILGCPFEILKQQMKLFSLETHPELPPLQTGVMGYFSYDLKHHIEEIQNSKDDMQFPDLVLGFYDLVIAFDLQDKKSWIISSGFPESGTKRETRAKQRMYWLEQQIKKEAPQQKISSLSLSKEMIQSNFNKEDYLLAVRKTLQHIRAGDIFQVNLSQRFTAKIPDNLSPLQLYKKLREINPAPFSAFLNYDEVMIASASPERFLKTNNKNVETRPIKGTRKRSADIQKDRALAEQLLQSEKDRAENVMIVDLLRNDLGRVCKNISVPKLCNLESFATVHHLVSEVTGELLDQNGNVDLIKACFPGGSITGAPKIRAMEIIAELEPVARGPYCGSVAYFGFDGSMDSSVIIRTYAIKNRMVSFHAGGGIVADSDPEQEYEETLVKAQALISALTS